MCYPLFNLIQNQPHKHARILPFTQVFVSVCYLVSFYSPLLKNKFPATRERISKPNHPFPLAKSSCKRVALTLCLSGLCVLYCCCVLECICRRRRKKSDKRRRMTTFSSILFLFVFGMNEIKENIKQIEGYNFL